MSVPRRFATCQMVSPSSASTSLPSRMNFTEVALPLPAVIVFAFSSPASQRLRQFFWKIFNHTQQRIRRGLPEATDGGIAHGGRTFFQQLHVPRALGHELGPLLGPGTAGRALTARFALEKLTYIPCGGLH